MELAYEASRALLVVAFLGYGIACLRGPSMLVEFERFGLARMRVLTGWLEVLGALGLAAGYVFPPLVVVSAGGLALLMLAGVLVRIRVQDPFRALVPALVLLAINVFVVVHALTAPAAA